MFTDGVPTTSSEFNTTVANAAITSSKNLKDDGATVYTVGIFTGANPDELHGDKYDKVIGSDITCDGNVGSYWGASTFSSIGSLISGDLNKYDVPAGNRFLNYMSSNYTNATEIGIADGSGIFSGYVWRITANFTRTAPVEDDYYLTASDSDSLNDIFQQISENIQTADISLGSETVIKDKVTQYFNVPEDASDVRIYTADYNGTSFGADETAGGVTAEVNKATGVVTVTGFDFNANFVSAEEKNRWNSWQKAHYRV